MDNIELRLRIVEAVCKMGLNAQDALNVMRTYEAWITSAPCIPDKVQPPGDGVKVRRRRRTRLAKENAP